MAETWRLKGFDTFSNEPYDIPGEFTEESAARAAVRKMLEEILAWQPTEDAGDPDEENSIQDYVILVHPDGTEEPFTTNHV